MSAEALSYILLDRFLSNEKLKVFYNFDTGSVFTALSGSSYYAFLKNSVPSYDTGRSNGMILETQSSTASGAYFKATGIFLYKNGSGYFPYSNIIITGQPNFNFNNCSMLFDFSNDKYSNGVLFGSFQKTQETINNVIYKESKGFNFGINDRGKLFFQSLSNIGEYVFTANNIELSKRNIVGLSIGANEIEISRFDYLNGDVQVESFSVNTNYIGDSELLYLGSSPNYYSIQTPLKKTFNGHISNLAIFSGNLTSDTLYDFGSGLLSSYNFNLGVVTEYPTITGYTTTTLYATGVTGYITEIIGFRKVLTGFDDVKSTGGFTFVGTSSEVEGSKIFNYYGGSDISYKEEIGLLYAGYSGTYNPTGLSAFDTLGLRNTNQNVDIYNDHIDVAGIYVNVPIYEVKALTGYTTEITGYIQTPLIGIVYETGVGGSELSFVGTSSKDFKKNYIYYLGERV